MTTERDYDPRYVRGVLVTVALIWALVIWAVWP